MEGEISEDIQDNIDEEVYQEDTDEEVSSENEYVKEAIEAEEVAEEAVEAAMEAGEIAETIAEGNEEAQIEAVSETDGGAIAQGSVEEFAQAANEIEVIEVISEAAEDLQAAAGELETVSEADRIADEKAKETVENVAKAQNIADSAATVVADTKDQADALIEVIVSNESDNELVLEAIDELDKLTNDAKEDIESKKAVFDVISNKFEEAKEELEAAQKIYDDTLKNLKSEDGNVESAAKKLEEAKNSVEVLSDAYDTAKENLDKEQDNAKDIIEKQTLSAKSYDWKSQDELMESVLRGYIVPNLIDKDATDITVSEFIRGFDRQNSSYCIVTYLDKDKNTVTRYFNYDRADRRFKADNQWYLLGNSRDIVIFEKSEEDITSSEYQKAHFGNYTNFNKFKAEVNAGLYDVYAFDHADGTKEYKCIDEIEAAVANGEMEVIDDVYYMNGVAGRKIVQATSGNATGLKVSTLDDEGFKAFVENASELVEKYEKYGEVIADTQDKLDEASDKVEILKDAIDNIEENEVRISKSVNSLVKANIVSGLRNYLSETEIARIGATTSNEEAVKVLEDILASAREELSNASADLDELIEKREEIRNNLNLEEEETVAEKNTVKEQNTTDDSNVIYDNESSVTVEESTAATNNSEQTITVDANVVRLIDEFALPVIPVASLEVSDIIAENNLDDNDPENIAYYREKVQKNIFADENIFTNATFSGDSDKFMQILGARRYNGYNKKFDEYIEKFVDIEEKEAPFVNVGSGNSMELSEDMPAESSMELSWLWILVIIILALTDKKMRDNRQKKLQELEVA